ncbi:MAG: winged helix-turn-helix transcriptional regulator [Pseudomonadota bacterium]
MDINDLVKLTSKAWSLQILAALDQGVPGRQAALLISLNVSRSAFPASLKHLIDIGLVDRNPGHGHPLRPEFRMTEKGRAAAHMAGKIVKYVDVPSLPALRKAWTVPVLAVSGKPIRFSGLRSALPAISDRALSQSLVLLENRCWIERCMDMSARTPFPIYRAINEGAMIHKRVREVA